MAIVFVNVMKPLARLFNQIIRLLGLSRPSRPEDIPKKLDAEALAAALREAEFLRNAHAVDVRAVAPDELPGLPRRADQ